jgi:hypothetical protein
MLMKIQLYSAIIAAALLSACAASGPAFVAEPTSGNQSTIYLFRPSKFANGGASPDVVLDGRKVGSISNGGYLPLHVPSGSHTLEIPYNAWSWDIRCAPVTLQTDASTTYYVAIDTDASLSFVAVSKTPMAHISRQCQLIELPEAVALPLIGHTRRSQ